MYIYIYEKHVNNKTYRLILLVGQSHLILGGEKVKLAKIRVNRRASAP